MEKEFGLQKREFDEFGLTKKEIEVLYLLSHGLSNREIAIRLNISVSTLRTHLKNVYRKLSIESRAKAVFWANNEYRGEIHKKLQK